MSVNSQKLHKCIIEFLLFEISSKNYSEDNVESLEVAKQCLETAWGIETTNISNELESLFNSKQKPEVQNNTKVSEEDKKSAEKLKSQGNICMGENLYNDAVSCYTTAIELDPTNAVYFCNRAAAYTKLNQNELAIEDCNRALKIDTDYGKAFSRMGLAYSAMNKFDEAIGCYQRALEIEPDNQNYKQNLQAAQEKKSAAEPEVTGSSGSAGPGVGSMPAGFQGMLGNMDIGSILNNPAMMNMAQEFMSRPEMRDMMGQMMHQMMGGPTQPGQEEEHGPQEPSNNSSAESAPVDPSTPPTDGVAVSATAPNPSVNDFLSFGQQFAHQVQSTHPELVESLRHHYTGGGTNTDASENPDFDSAKQPPAPQP